MNMIIALNSAPDDIAKMKLHHLLIQSANSKNSINKKQFFITTKNFGLNKSNYLNFSKNSSVTYFFLLFNKQKKNGIVCQKRNR